MAISENQKRGSGTRAYGTFFQGILVPASTSKEIIEKWHRDAAEAVLQPEQEQTRGRELRGCSLDTLLINSEVAQWGKIIQDARIPKVQ